MPPYSDAVVHCGMGALYIIWEFVGGELCAEGILDFATSFNISDI